ncbi:MAG: manganese efflux pump [Bacilli bacterium]|nr:manganese efflux pump [Bacilli bacterium]
MKIFELIIISFSLASDAFSVSICKGLTIKKNIKKSALIIALSFSFFQVLMPILGYLLGSSLNSYFLKFNKLIAFGLLFIIGINMLKDSFEKEYLNDKLTLKELLNLSVATSIDAFSIGITFSLFNINLPLTYFLIGTITFALSYIGVFIGNIFGNKFEKTASILGGIILLLLSLKFLLEHLNVI